MKRTISAILTLALFASLFAGLTVSASAASDGWSVYSEHSYYDAQNKTDYHVVFSFKESYKTWLWVFKDYFISQMKVDTYVTTLSGSKAKVVQKTSILAKNSKAGINTCTDYLSAYYPSLYNSYKSTLREQENYRMLYIHKASGSTRSFISEYCNYTIQRYTDKYKQFALSGFKGDINDAIAKASGVVLPATLELLGSASSVVSDANELKELCTDAIGTLYNIVELYWLEQVDRPTQEQLADGPPSVKNLLTEVNKYATSSSTTTKSRNADKRVKLATSIYTHPLG